ncbi:type IV toxin-antitoxin system YeeU family antitoxin [Escherichia coli]|uniref:type IV toxin-antitoxin system YeeU family antitoxin n=1 Tax=Escherichia coli TaxID=562 RepID=UPI001F14D92B
MSDTLPGTTLPDDNHDRPWWGLPCTVTPCFGARLVQEGNRLHYLADRAGIRGLFSDADAYHLDQAFPLLMKQLELMLTSGELNPRHQHTVTLYAKGLTCAYFHERRSLNNFHRDRVITFEQIAE